MLHSTLLALFVVAPVGEPFGDCQFDSELSHGWKVTCVQRVASIVDLANSDGEAYIDGAVAAFRAMAASGVYRTENTAMPLPGEGWRVLRLEAVHANTGARIVGFVASVVRVEGTRVLTCMGVSSAEPRCRAMLVALASHRWREEGPGLKVDKGRRARFAGRDYVTPANCEISTQGNATTVVCGGELVLLWAQPPNNVDLIEDAAVQKMRNEGSTEGRDVCVIDGIPSTCRIFRSNRGGSEAAYMVRTTIRGESILAVCLVKDVSKGLPPACASVMSLRRDTP